MKEVKSTAIIDFLFKDDNAVAVFIFLAAFFVRFAFLLFTDNYAGEQPMLKLITSLHIFSSWGFFENVYYQHLPFYLYSLAFSLWLGGEQLFAGRMYSLLVASVTVVLFFYFVKMFFGRKNAILSGVLLCCLPGHIIKSVLTLPDVNSIFFVLLGLYFFEKGRIGMTALSILIAAANDYLAWIFIPVIALSFLLFSKKEKTVRIKSMVLFLLISISFPVLWSISITQKYGTMEFLLAAGDTYSSGMRFMYGFMYNVRDLLMLLKADSHPAFFWGSILGIGYCFMRKRHEKIIFWIGAAVLFGCILSLRREIGLLKQIAFLVLVFSCPFISELILFAAGKLKKKENILFLAAGGWLCVELLIKAVSMSPFLPKNATDTADWLNKNATAADHIILEKDKDGLYSSIVMLSGLPQGNFYVFSADENKKPVFQGAGKNVFWITSSDYWFPGNVCDRRPLFTAGNYRIFKING